MSTLGTQSRLPPSLNGALAGKPRLFDEYAAHTTAWDELFDRTGAPHAHCGALVDRLGRFHIPEFQAKRTSADLAFVNQGITFTVYSDRRGVEKIFPFDLIPRTIPAAEWANLEAGLVQRIEALNLFLHDVYHDQRILQRRRDPDRAGARVEGVPQGDDRVHAARRACTSTSAAPT